MIFFYNIRLFVYMIILLVFLIRFFLLFLFGLWLLDSAIVVKYKILSLRNCFCEKKILKVFDKL